MEQHTIELEHEYAHPIEAVWEAISDAAAISKWFIEADFKPLVGYDYTFTHESTTVTGKVLEVDPPSLLKYTWIVGGVETTVSWRLSEREGRTTLKLVHEGIEKYADTAAHMFTTFTGGWEHCIAELETYLTTQHV